MYLKPRRQLASFRHFSTVLVVAFAMPVSVAIAGGTCTVPGSHATIQMAVDDGLCDTINITGGPYFETVVIDHSVTINGNGVTIDANALGPPIEVDGSAAGGIIVNLNNLVLNGGVNRFGGGLAIVESTVGNETVVVGTALTISNNIASNTSSSGFGGAAYVGRYCTLNLSGSTISGNTASLRPPTFTGSGSGGGFYVRGPEAYLIMTTSQISNNLAAMLNGSGKFAMGGGLRMGDGSTVTLSSNTWYDNTARNDGADATAVGFDTPADGGAIAVVLTTGTATLNITGDTFYGNIADKSNENLSGSEYGRGGAISLMSSNTAALLRATFDGITVYDNIAKNGTGTGEGRGGGIAARGVASLIIRNSKIYDNRADSLSQLTDIGFGGGLYVREPFDGDNGYVEITNTIFADNIACNHITPSACNGDQVYVNYVGGGMHALEITNSTLASENLTTHEALWYEGTTAGDELLLLNSIFANHRVGVHNINATGWARGRYLLYSGNTIDKEGAAFPGSPPDSDSNFTGNADFVSPATRDYHIQATSDAIDLGRNEDVGAFTYNLTTDIDGDPRGTNPGDMVDSGADEYNATGAIFADDFETGGVTMWSSSTP